MGLFGELAEDEHIDAAAFGRLKGKFGTREGAVPAVSGADILLWYGLARPEQPEKAKPDGAPLSLDAQRMRDAMSAAAPLPLDALCAKTGLPPPKAMAALTELELAGFSRQLAGRQFQLK